MRLITLAIHTYEKAMAVRALLETEGIAVTLQNVNLDQPEISPGVRIRIYEKDLPLALRIVENPDIFNAGIENGIVPLQHRCILVPVDFTTHSFNAAKLAVRLAAARKVDVCFLHSYIDPQRSAAFQLSDNLTYDDGEADTTEHLVAVANAEMAKFAENIRAMMKRGELPVVRFSSTVLEGVPEETIMRFAKANSPYLIVMGTRSVERKERDMIGSVAAEVLDESMFSVLTVPETIELEIPSGPRNILFFSNLEQEDIIAMDTLYRIFANSAANVTIVHVPVRNRFTDRLAGRSAIGLSDYCRKTFSQFNFKSVPIVPKNALKEFEELQAEHRFDLLVIPSRRKNALMRLFNPGLAHKILFQTDVPMLVIPV